MKNFIFVCVFFATLPALAFPIPKDNEVTFDVIRKNKNIGTVDNPTDGVKVCKKLSHLIR